MRRQSHHGGPAARVLPARRLEDLERGEEVVGARDVHQSADVAEHDSFAGDREEAVIAVDRDRDRSVGVWLDDERPGQDGAHAPAVVGIRVRDGEVVQDRHDAAVGEGSVAAHALGVDDEVERTRARARVDDARPVDPRLGDRRAGRRRRGDAGRERQDAHRDQRANLRPHGDLPRPAGSGCQHH